MKYSLLFLLAFSISASFISCHKHENTSDTIKPVITIAEPMASDTLSLAVDPEVHLECTVTDETSLHAMHVYLIRNAKDTLLHDEPSVHDLTVYAYHEHTIPTGIVGITPMTAVFSAEDHNGNVETKTINFFVEP